MTVSARFIDALNLLLKERGRTQSVEVALPKEAIITTLNAKWDPDTDALLVDVQIRVTRKSLIDGKSKGLVGVVVPINSRRRLGSPR